MLANIQTILGCVFRLYYIYGKLPEGRLRRKPVRGMFDVAQVLLSSWEYTVFLKLFSRAQKASMSAVQSGSLL